MELHLSYRDDTEVPQENHVRNNTPGREVNYHQAVQDEECRSDPRSGMCRSCSSICSNTTKAERIKLHGIPEGEECIDAF